MPAHRPPIQAVLYTVSAAPVTSSNSYSQRGALSLSRPLARKLQCGQNSCGAELLLRRNEAGSRARREALEHILRTGGLALADPCSSDGSDAGVGFNLKKKKGRRQTVHAQQAFDDITRMFLFFTLVT
jgi:hypothetical protein